MRSGIQPLEALKILEGRIVSSHLKDLNEFGKNDAHDVHFGEGLGKIKEVLDEYRRQGFQGNISIEYEHNWDNNVDDVAACIDLQEYGEGKYGILSRLRIPYCGKTMPRGDFGLPRGFFWMPFFVKGKGAVAESEKRRDKLLFRNKDSSVMSFSIFPTCCFAWTR
jgi:hypothetical protein